MRCQALEVAVTAQPTSRLTAQPTSRLTAQPTYPNPIEKNQWRRRFASLVREAPRVLDYEKVWAHGLRPIGKRHRRMCCSLSNLVSTPPRSLYGFATPGAALPTPRRATPTGR